MAFISQSSGLTVAADTETIVYDGTTNNSGLGAPTNGAVMIGLVAANIGNATSNVQIYKRTTAGSAGTDDIYIVKNVPVPEGSSLDALPSKIVLNSTDKIYMKTSVANAIQVTASLLEN
jgi:phosphatidylserine synthase